MLTIWNIKSRGFNSLFWQEGKLHKFATETTCRQNTHTHKKVLDFIKDLNF